MTHHKIFISFAIAAAAIVPTGELHAALPYDNISQAVMKTYDEMLRENFRDYEVLYRRANDLYHHEEYLTALGDLDRASRG
ncbi:MAG: hypothetical protein K2M97_05980, partial [Muribaculaceae bacterium]|nr:hypothetical protein [Muribaculaceae bacterium]